MVSESSASLLLFDSTLLSTMANPIPLKKLLERIQAVQSELSTMDQESVDLSSLETVKNELVSKKILKHANVGVQAYACCAIADILRIYAPDAPFTAAELSLIFKTFLSQIARLSQQDNPYFQQQSYLLKRLAEVRSIILITDLPDATQLVQTTFETFYETAATNFPARLESLAADILAEVIAESDQIPNSILKMILNKFLTSAPESALTSARSNIRNPGFQFSLHICEQNIDRLSRQVVQFFSEILAEAVPDSAQDKDRSAALESLRKIHNLTVQVWKFIPDLLTAVIGLIDDELNADDPRLRSMATETIGQMVAASGLQKQNFAITHKLTWQLWLKKTLDVSLQVRCKWLDLIPSIVTSNCTSEMANELSNGVTKCLLDTDDRVRLAACRCLSNVSFESFTTTIGSVDILNTLSLLIRESQSEIREQSLEILGNFYNQYYILMSTDHSIDYGTHAQDESNDLSHIIVNDVPNHVLSLIYINDKSINAAVDLCLFEKFVPFETNTKKRVLRLVQLVSVLNEKSRKAFFAITKRQQQVAGVVSTLIKIADNRKSALVSDDDKENNPEEQGKQLEKVINWISASFPDGLDTYSCIERFALLHNRRFFNLLSVIVSPESDFSLVKNSMKELLNKLSNAKNIKLDYEKLVVSPADMVSNFKLLLYRASPILYNVSNIEELIAFAATNTNSAQQQTATEILQDISSTLPSVLETHIEQLVQLVSEDDSKDKADVMRMIYHFVKGYPDRYPKGLSTDILERKTRFGTPLEARYAVKILSKSLNKEIAGTAISNLLLPLETKADLLPTHISAIGELFKSDRESVEPSASDVTATIIQDVLLKNDIKSNGTDWIDDMMGHASLYLKVLALRLFVNRIRSCCVQAENEEKLKDIAEPVFKLFYALVNSGGDIISTKGENSPLPKNYLLRLRLAAGFSLLKLAKYPQLESFFDERIACLTHLIQDSTYEVRNQFLRKLQAYSTNESIPDKFLPFVFYAANELNDTLKNQTSSWVKSLLRREQDKNTIQVERSLVRLIHLLSHEKLFLESMEEDTLQAYEFAANYVVYFLQCVEKMENASLLYYLASRVKQYRDSTLNATVFDEDPVPPKATALYCIAELCQLAIKEVCDYKNYTMQTWPGKLHLPLDIFGPIRSSEEAYNIVSKVYIPDEIQAGLRNSIRAKYVGAKRRAEQVPRPQKKSKKAVASIKSASDQTEDLNQATPTRTSRRRTKKVTYKEVVSEDSESGSASDAMEESDYE